MKINPTVYTQAAWGVTLFLLALIAPTSAQADGHTSRVGLNTALTFEETRSSLTSDAKERLDALIRNAKTGGKIKEVQVAAWSDNPAPRQNEELSKSDRDLADKRAKSIRQYLKSNAKVSVSTYNMAERANWLARTLDTSDAELKAEIGRGNEMPMSKSEYQVFKDHGQPSRAVVLVIMKNP